jgi:peptidoglycan/xylan/chitin deacetylase (PgdA/CDA1 family)
LRYNSFYEYGARVAIFRLLDLFDRLGLSVTVAANALACERYPNIVESFICRGYEIAAHGIAVNRMMSDKLTMEQEKEEIEQTLTRIAGVTGRKPKGWIGQDFRESLNTPSLLAAAGLSYLADWPNDDEPRVMDGASNLVSVPIAYECDDLRLFIERRMQAWIYPDLIRDAFATLYKEGLQRPRVLPLAVHPWVFGAPHRIRYLEKALAPLAAIDGLWWAKAESIADITVTDR